MKNLVIKKWADTEDGQKIYYEDTGGVKPVIVFQSGFMGIHDIWKYQVEELRSSFRCITHDNRGYGLSSSPQEGLYYSVEANVNDLRSVLEDAKIAGPFLLVTHSMGSTYGVEFTVRYPQLVKGIIMTGGATISGEIFKRNGAKEDIFSSFHTSPEESMKFYYNFGLEEAIAIEAAKWTNSVFKNQTKAIMDYATSEHLSMIIQPVKVLHGARDVVSSLEGPNEAVAKLPNAHLDIIEDANHFPITENPTLINNIIRSFSTELENI